MRRPLPNDLAAPARRALASKEIEHLDDLAKFTEAEVLDLHGMGPHAMKKLKEAMVEAKVSFFTR